MTYKYLLLATVLCTLGCNMNLNDHDPLPKKVKIHKGFSPVELEAIDRAIKNINDVLIRPCLGFDGIIPSGTLYDEFDENGNDFEDGIHGIYKINRDTKVYQTLVYLSGEPIVDAYSTIQDMVVVTNLDKIPVLREEISQILEDPNYENNEDKLADVELKQSEINNLFSFFYTVVRHELGHMIGLSHNPDTDSMMYPYEQRSDHFTDIDKEFFSEIRGCEYE